MLCITTLLSLLFFFFNDTATTEIYTLSLHDALPIFKCNFCNIILLDQQTGSLSCSMRCGRSRSEEHTSELQSLTNLVCRLLLEKKKNLTPSSAQNSVLMLSPRHPTLA